MEQKNQVYIIAVDIGTTSTEAILYQEGQGIKDSFSIGYQTYYPKPGMVEQDAEEILKAVVEVLRQLIEKTKVPAKNVAGIVFGGIWQSILAVSKEGTPLTPAMTWADSRSIKQSQQLRVKLEPEEFRQRTGCGIHPMYFLPKLAWLQEKAPEIVAETHKFISIKEYVLYHLFGEFVVDKSIASGTGIWRISTMDWDDEVLQVVKLGREKFSRVVEPTTILSGLKTDYADRIGLLPGTPGVVGAADGALSHLGSVGLADDKMSLTVGTGAAVRRLVLQPLVKPKSEAWCYYCLEGTWLLGGIIQDAGNVIKWFVDNVIAQETAGEDDFERMNRYAAACSPGADGLIFLPFLGGERCPRNNPFACGVIYGLTFSHEKKHMARALIEGIAYRLYSVYQMLLEKNEPELVVAGGLLKSEVGLQITADFFGKNLWIPKIQAASAWGGVLVALRALGIIEKREDITGWVHTAGKKEPNKKNHELYQMLYGLYEALYEKVLTTSGRIAVGNDESSVVLPFGATEQE